MAEEGRVIEQAYYYPVPPEKVFKALTKKKTLVKWFLKDATIKPKAGSAYKFVWEGGYTHDGKVEEVDLGKRIVLTWPDKIKGKTYETKVSFTLAKKGKGTMLKVKHTGFKEGNDWVWLYGAVQSGWAYYLTNLKSVLAEGVDLRSEYDAP